MTVQDDLRTSQTTATRRRIAAATVEVIVRDGLASVTFPAVAEQAGVSLRTVYRHFPNKDELLAAATQSGSERVMDDYPRGSVRVPTMREFIPRLWAELEQQRDAVLLQHVTAAGAAVRRERFQQRLVDTRRAVGEDYPELDAASQERVALLLTSLLSSSLLFDLVDRLDVPVEEAGFLAAYAIESVVQRALSEGAVR